MNGVGARRTRIEGAFTVHPERETREHRARARSVEIPVDGGVDMDERAYPPMMRAGGEARPDAVHARRVEPAR